MSDAYRAQVAALLLGLDEEHVKVVVRTVQRIKMVQEKELHADIILKFQDGKACHGGGFMVKD